MHVTGGPRRDYRKCGSYEPPVTLYISAPHAFAPARMPNSPGPNKIDRMSATGGKNRSLTAGRNSRPSPPERPRWVESGHRPRYQTAMKRLFGCGALILLASGCEQLQPMLSQAGYTHDLGDFEIERVSVVQEMPGSGDGYDGGGHLRIDLASTSQLSLGYPTYWIGVASDYCPLTDDHNLIAMGFYGDGKSFRDSSVGQSLKKSADGLYHYAVYVVRAYPPPGKTRDDFGGPQTGPYAQNRYDIVHEKKDLCLQFFGGDHYNVFARSSGIRVSYEAVRRAAIDAKMIRKP